MSYPKSCEYKGWMKSGGGNCFQRQDSINSPRKRCNGPAGCVWRSRSPKKSPSRERCVWGKRSIRDQSVGMCYNRGTEKFDNTGWRKCNYPSNCVGKRSYNKKIYNENDSDDEDDGNEIDDKKNKLPRKMNCEDTYKKNLLKLNEKETEFFYKNIIRLSNLSIDVIVEGITGKPKNIKTFTDLYKKLNVNDIFKMCKSNNNDASFFQNIRHFIEIAGKVFEKQKLLKVIKKN